MMQKIGALVVAFLVALLVPPATATIHSELKAQPTPTKQDGPSVARMKRVFATRVSAIEKRCHLGNFFQLETELDATHITLVKRIALLSEAAQTAGQDRRLDLATRKSDAEAAIEIILRYLGTIRGHCSPKTLELRVIDAKIACRPDRANLYLARFRTVVRLYKERSDVAQAAGSRSTIDPAQARKDYLSALEDYKWASNFEAKDCETPRTGDTDSGSETIEMADISGEPEEPLAEASPTDEMERQWSWIAGLWDINRIGGQIEYRVEADGTLSAYIAATNKRMIEHGYTAGMQVARGYRLAGTNGVTWRYWANGGEIFSARHLGRGLAGQGHQRYYHTAEWIAGGVIHLHKDQTNVSFPHPLLINRLANYNPLSRPDTSALDNIIAEYGERAAALEEAGTQAERMQLVQSAIEALDSQSASSADAQRAAQMLGLLSEREELRDNPQLADALSTLEQSSNAADEAAAWQTLVAHMTASGAHFAQPIRGNEYDDQAAAHMFRVVRYASTLQDDLRDARGALTNSNISRTTAALARLQGIAALAGDPRSQSAGTMMEGVRNLSVRPGGVPGLTSAFEFPAAIATGMLDNTIAGVRASADVLVDVGRATGGNRASERRAISAARKVNAILSAPGYANSVLRSVGNRVIERIPFVRTMANWFR